MTEQEVITHLSIISAYDGDEGHNAIGYFGPYKLYILSFKTDYNHVLSLPSENIDLNYTIYLNESSSLTIPEAAQASTNTPHDSIIFFIEPGTYNLDKHIYFYRSLITEASFSLISTQGSSETVLVGLPNQANGIIKYHSCSRNGIHDVTIKGFTIINGQKDINGYGAGAIGVFNGYTKDTNFEEDVKEEHGPEVCTLKDLIIKDCGGRYGAVDINATTVNLDNVLIFDSYGYLAIIFQRYTDESNYNNLTIVNNTVSHYQGAICLYSYGDINQIINNSIIYNNNSPYELVGSTSNNTSLLINNSNIINNFYGFDSYTLNSCISDNPLFFDVNEDFHLQCISPCINTGNSNLVPVDLLYDLDGNPRIIETVDMGVYEAVTDGVTLEPIDDVCIDDPAFELTGGFPTGGIYSGTGVIDGYFYPDVAGVGTHLITYTFGCDDASQNITVNPIPSSGLTIIGSTVCKDKEGRITINSPEDATYKAYINGKFVGSGIGVEGAKSMNIYIRKRPRNRAKHCYSHGYK